MCRRLREGVAPVHRHRKADRRTRASRAAGSGTIRRSDGSRQATYAGRPLYYYVGDRKPRQILCQNVSEFGGLWLVVRPSGAVVR